MLFATLLLAARPGDTYFSIVVSFLPQIILMWALSAIACMILGAPSVIGHCHIHTRKVIWLVKSFRSCYVCLACQTKKTTSVVVQICEKLQHNHYRYDSWKNSR